MVSIRYTLLAGRYHATGWDRHVNEGDVEWPPSPWRVLRSLIAGAWLQWPDGPPAVFIQSIERLGQTLPVFQLPEATFAHTRHYMPIVEGAKQKTGLVFDAFAVTSKDAQLTVCWPTTELNTEQLRALNLAAAHISYLGRAEAWAEASVDDAGAQQVHAEPVSHEHPLGAPSRRLLAPGPLPKGKPTKRGQWFPESTWQALHADTSRLQRDRWTQAPGSRWVDYSVALPARTRARSRSPDRLIRGLLCSVWSKVPAKMDRGLGLAEGVRGAVNYLVRDCPELHGHAPDGTRSDQDRHARFLPYSARQDGRIDQLLIWFPVGLQSSHVRRIQAGLRQMEFDLHAQWRFANNGRELRRAHPVRVVPLQALTHDEVGVSPICRAAKIWRSITPMVLTRHPKMYADGRPKLNAQGLWRDGPEDQLRRELRHQGLLTHLTSVKEVEGANAGDRTVPWRAFRRQRLRGRGLRFGGIGHGFELRFDRPVRGPINLGYARNFGLGTFAPLLGTFTPLE